VTHRYGNREGIRYLASGVKVYYVPLLPVYQQAALPSIFMTFPYFRNILLREQIDIVHSHQVRYTPHATLYFLSCSVWATPVVFHLVSGSTTPFRAHGLSLRLHGSLAVWFRRRKQHPHEQASQGRVLQRQPRHLRVQHKV